MKITVVLLSVAILENYFYVCNYTLFKLSKLKSSENV